MRVLIASAEAVPFAKVGGLADVVGSLPAALRCNNVDARVILPGYGLIQHYPYNIQLAFAFDFHHRMGTTDVRVYHCVYNGVPFYFVQGHPFIGQEHSVYTHWDWDARRFIWFNQAAMAVIYELNQREGWLPDVVHTNDWHTALLPFLIGINRWKQEWRTLATVATVHNIAYMGNYVQPFLYEAGIPARDWDLINRFGLHDNMLGIGLATADKINTVSPRYALEIQYRWAGYELADLMHYRRHDLVGILNGIDVALWNPATDPHLVQQYDAENFAQLRPRNKHALQEQLGLPTRSDAPMIGVVSRLTAQKGFDFAFPGVRRILTETNAQFVLLGTGEASIENAARRLADDFPHQVRVHLDYNGTLAQRIYSAIDLFLMPSHFEPCGIGQMLAMRYGALPVVRETGGLADTVQNYDNANADFGTGFVFQWETPDAVAGTLHWAIRTYFERPDAWRRMQYRAMTTDFSWATSARQYVNLYEQAVRKIRGA
jgi:starch synthase